MNIFSVKNFENTQNEYIFAVVMRNQVLKVAKIQQVHNNEYGL